MAPETIYLQSDPDNGFPNSPLPVLLYRHAVDKQQTEARATAFEALFERHGWPPSWRYHLYDFQHFHSNTHEALGVFRGHARAQLGGPNGPTLTLEEGDVLVLPAGTGHACLEDEGDFCMVGAYPAGYQPDLERGDPAKFAAAAKRVAGVALPEKAPIGGSLTALWRSGT